VDVGNDRFHITSKVGLGSRDASVKQVALPVWDVFGMGGTGRLGPCLVAVCSGSGEAGALDWFACRSLVSDKAGGARA
jgi:hypothetical protein